MRPFTIDVSVAVVGGIGSTSFTSYGGELKVTSVKVPGAGTAHFDYFIEDDALYVLAGRTDIPGSGSVAENMPHVRAASMNVINAGVDGTYLFRLNMHATGGGGN